MENMFTQWHRNAYKQMPFVALCMYVPNRYKSGNVSHTQRTEGEGLSPCCVLINKTRSVATFMGDGIENEVICENYPLTYRFRGQISSLPCTRAYIDDHFLSSVLMCCRLRLIRNVKLLTLRSRDRQRDGRFVRPNLLVLNRGVTENNSSVLIFFQGRDDICDKKMSPLSICQDVCIFLIKSVTALKWFLTQISNQLL